MLPQEYESYEALLQPRSRPQSLVPKSRRISRMGWEILTRCDREPGAQSPPPGSRWTGPGLNDQSGGSYTVKQVSRTLGPSERYTADLSDLDQSTLNTVTAREETSSAPLHGSMEAWYKAPLQLPFSRRQ